MKGHKFFILLVLIGFGIFSCKKPPPVTPLASINDIETASLVLGSTVSSNFFGRIVDENGGALEGVTVTAGDKSSTTDVNGVFRIQQASVNEKLAFVKAEKSGYFLGSRSLIPITTGYNYVEIAILPRELSGTFASGDTYTVIAAPGVKVEFQGQYVDDYGNDYFGQVKTYVKYIPPTDPSMSNRKPGSAYGQGRFGQEIFFETHGMLLVEIEGNSGQHIQIARDSYATLRFRITPDQLSLAQPSIPMAYFSTNTGYWVEQGAAVLTEDEFVAQVGHFSYGWNAAMTYNSCVGEGQFENYYGDSLVNFPIEINSYNGKHIVRSNSNGTYKSHLPSGINISYHAVDQCGDDTEVSFSAAYAAGSSNIFTVEIQNGIVDLIQEQGALVDCGGLDITDGYVLVYLGSYTYIQYVTNGNFELDNINCESMTSYEAIGYNFSTGSESVPKPQVITVPVTSLGDIIVCGSYTEYLSYSIDSGPAVEYFSDIYCARLDTGGGWYFEIYPLDNSITIIGSQFEAGPYAYFANLQPGTIWIQPSDMDPIQNFNYGINLVNFGNVGNYVTILFTGTYTDGSLVTHTIDGELAVVRDF